MFSKRTFLPASLVLVVAAAGLAVPPAQAKTKHRYTSVIRNAAVLTASGYPAPGGKAVLAGTWDTKLFGAGAIVDRVEITGQPAPNTFTFKGTEICFVARGTFRDVFTGTAVVQPDGSQKISTKGTFTGGTGAYKGAKGSFTFTGATAPGGQIVVGRSSGTITY